MKFIFITIFIITNFLYAKTEMKEYNDIKLKLIKEKDIPEKYINSFFNIEDFSIIDSQILEKFSEKKIIEHRKSEFLSNKNKMKNEIPFLLEHLKLNNKLYTNIEKHYKVNREIISSILLKETNLGKYKLKYKPIVVFNSLVKGLDNSNSRNIKLRKMALDSLEKIIVYSYINKLSIEEIKEIRSSYAGAIGYSQFMPFNLIYVVSYNNKTPNINSMEDSIASIANYSNKVMDLKELIEWSKMPNIEDLYSMWEKYNNENKWIPLISFKDNSFIAILKNNNKLTKKEKQKFIYFEKIAKKILKYNNSSDYAIGVLMIAQESSKQRFSKLN